MTQSTIIVLFVITTLVSNVYALNFTSIFFSISGRNETYNTSWNFDVDDAFGTSVCSPHDQFAIIAHGWKENCSTPWVQELTKNLQSHRGGCIICMDYRRFATLRQYGGLVAAFRYVVRRLTEKLLELQTEGFDPAKGYFFGFDFGAQVGFHAILNAFGRHRFGAIDVCDPNLRGFDKTARFLNNYSIAAINVQCIHTSVDKGTAARTCHQDWNMGVCGDYQVATDLFPFESHGLCPHFYNNAFNHSFRAVRKMESCLGTKRDLAEWPDNYQMGYLESRKEKVNGVLYAETSDSPPYNS